MFAYAVGQTETDRPPDSGYGLIVWLISGDVLGQRTKTMVRCPFNDIMNGTEPIAMTGRGRMDGRGVSMARARKSNVLAPRPPVGERSQPADTQQQ